MARQLRIAMAEFEAPMPLPELAGSNSGVGAVLSRGMVVAIESDVHHWTRANIYFTPRVS